MAYKQTTEQTTTPSSVQEVEADGVRFTLASVDVLNQGDDNFAGAAAYTNELLEQHSDEPILLITLSDINELPGTSLDAAMAQAGRASVEVVTYTGGFEGMQDIVAGTVDAGVILWVAMSLMFFTDKLRSMRRLSRRDMLTEAFVDSGMLIGALGLTAVAQMMGDDEKAYNESRIRAILENTAIGKEAKKTGKMTILLDNAVHDIPQGEVVNALKGHIQNERGGLGGNLSDPVNVGFLS